MHADRHQCGVCREAAAKYKCPKCRLQYCSVGCYKSHQSKPCQPSQQAPPRQEVEHGEARVSRQQVLFPTDDTVPPRTLEKLRESNKLKALLGNPHLRDMLGEVDGAPNAQVAMRRAMMEPLFTEFADEVLGVVEPDLEAAAASSAKHQKGAK